jgi:hypothetical protein
VDEDPEGEFTWHRHGHSGLDLKHLSTIDDDIFASSELEIKQADSSDDAKPETLFFRFAFLNGAEAGTYGGPGIWLEDGGWISPPQPKN